MELTIEVILFALLVLVLNVMDSVTTNLCFRQYPDKELKGEGNPIMRWVMLKSRVLAEVFKQGFILCFVVYFLMRYDLITLRMAAIMFGLVVLNNTYIFVSRAVTKRKVVAPTKRLLTYLHLPDKYSYVVVLAVIFLLSGVIYRLAWG